MTQPTQENESAQPQATALAKRDYGIDVGRVVAMRAAVEEVVKQVLHEGEHYGVIPGTTKEGKKPRKSLLQPGAEVLCQVFRLRPEYVVETRDERPDFILREIRCKLYNSVTGELVGEALGSANSREEKYLAQTASRLCPSCGKATIFRSKKREGDVGDPGWFCWANKGGCGMQFSADDKKLLDQVGAVSADKVLNLHHTIISIAQKRAYVKAVRNATATSDIFTDEPDSDYDITGDDAATIAAKIARTSGIKPATVPKAGATEVQKLADALAKHKIGMAVDPSLPRDQQQEQIRKVRVAWANGHLTYAAEEPVKSLLELTPAQIAWLLPKAEKGECPSGW
jgi:hypothetical protein